MEDERSGDLSTFLICDARNGLVQRLFVVVVVVCVPLRVGKTLVVTMGSQVAYAARALRQPRPHLGAISD